MQGDILCIQIQSGRNIKDFNTEEKPANHWVICFLHDVQHVCFELPTVLSLQASQEIQFSVCPKSAERLKIQT